MPTYNAVGVTATLSVASLQASCSNVIDLTMRDEQRKDADRIAKVFASGRNLPENPVDIGDGEGGAIHFIGDNEDLPFFMVEAGNGTGSSSHTDLALKAEGAVRSTKELSAARRSQHPETDSPLTSLGATPTGSFLIPHEESPTQARPTPKPKQRKARKTNNGEATAPARKQRSSFSEFERVRPFLEQAGGPQALCLTIETCYNSFLPPSGQQRRTGKDLKLEVFVNGQLAGVSFINTRGSAIELKNDKVRFQGTRVHRQMERPWTYNAEADGRQGSLTAEERWCAVAEALDVEARARGRNRWGDCPPSAELLVALSNLGLPEHLEDRRALGVVDVIITAGKGRKYGPETAYLTKPVRMDDPEYTTATTISTNVADDPFADDVILLGSRISNINPSPLRGRSALEKQQSSFAQSSPEVPLIVQHREHSAAYMPDTPSRKKRRTEDLASTLSLDLTGVDLDRPVGSFETVRGNMGKRRTLLQRLSDIKQMNPKNREKQIAALREELGEDTLRAVDQEVIEMDTEPSPTKKARLDANSHDLGLNMLADAALAAALEAENGNGTVDPMKLWRTAPSPVQQPEGPNPEAVLAQDRIDMALGAGASSNGHLLRHIASTSPQSTPKKKTRASALANSPCSVPVKEQSKQNKTPTPQRSMYYPRLGSPIPIDPTLTGSPPSTSRRSGRGANRTRAKWDPTEQTHKEALKAFEIPGTCKGSVVTYADAECERQIGKARHGEFREETVLVGMRFIVT